MLNKLMFIIASCLCLVQRPFYAMEICRPVDSIISSQPTGKEVLDFNEFKPTVHIKQRTEEDKSLSKKLRNLYFEDYEKNARENRRRVRRKAIKEYGAQEVVFYSKDVAPRKNQKTGIVNTDDYKLAGLWVEREDAPVNIVYATGYYHDLTPTKEWALPFLEVFPKYNILVFDWRGFGQSSRKFGNEFLEPGDYGSNAYCDLLAAIDFVRSKNNKPVVLHGFCFGGAMSLLATVKAKELGRRGPDAVGVSCMFTKFESLFKRAFLVEDRWFYWLLMWSGLGSAMLDYMTNGSLFDVHPVELVKHIDVPCWFDHPVTDPFAPIEEGAEVYDEVKSPKMFVMSDFGLHVRLHGKAPHQYRKAYEKFLNDNVIKN